MSAPAIDPAAIRLVSGLPTTAIDVARRLRETGGKLRHLRCVEVCGDRRPADEEGEEALTFVAWSREDLKLDPVRGVGEGRAVVEVVDGGKQLDRRFVCGAPIEQKSVILAVVGSEKGDLALEARDSGTAPISKLTDHPQSPAGKRSRSAVAEEACARTLPGGAA